jgi:O-antigen ligase
MTEALRRTPRVSSPPAPVASWFGPAAWFLYADLLAVLVAAALPWSTTAVGTLLVLWLLSLIPLLPTLESRALLGLLARPICLLPLAMVALALVGTLWADVPWRERIQGVSPAAKLLVLPILLYHFERSQRGAWVFIGFLASCALLMGLSWIVLFVPELALAPGKSAGVPVKNYIDQSQEFALCMVALTPFVFTLYQRQRYALAMACAALVLGFFANMAFVASARAALIYVPALLIVFAVMHLNRRATALLFAGLVVVAAMVWFTSSYLQTRIAAFSVEYQDYQQNIPASTGRRLEYWQKSLGFFAEAPLFGHGTGSIEHLFEQAAVGHTGLAAEITRNPHNQTLNVAVQWGIVGVAVLYAMWLAHLLLFRGQGLANWIGLLVVVQNLVSSLFNAHLFDFVEGWMYVLGVGIAGGMSLGARRRAEQPDVPARL